VLWFSALYFGFAVLTASLARLLARFGYGRVLDTRTLPPGQLQREIGESLVSILVSGFGLLAPLGMLKPAGRGWRRISRSPAAAAESRTFVIATSSH